MEIDNKHYLFGDSRLSEFPMTKALSSPPQFRNAKYPDTIIIHYTAMFDYQAAIRSLSDYSTKGGNASAHLVIGKNGEIAQLAPFNYKTWHAGESSYDGLKHFNNFSIGIEIDNLGWLDYFENGDFYSRRKLQEVYPDKAEAKRSKDEIFEGKHWNTKFRFKYWDKYTKKQEEAVRDICVLLCKQYNIKHILGHDEISVDRKSDPGPAFPMDWLKEEALSFDRRDEPGEEEEMEAFEGKVTATKLNIRSGPGAENAKVAQPLIQGTPLKVLEKAGNWYKVKAEITGWVSADHVKPKNT